MQQITDDANNAGNILSLRNKVHIEEINIDPFIIKSCNIILQRKREF